MVSWMVLLVAVAVVAGVSGLGPLLAAMKIVMVVSVLLAGIGWAHRPAGPVARSIS
jgi:hypothetical protein